MMSQEEEGKRNLQLLKGETNYLGWKKIMKAHLKKKKYVIENVFVEDKQEEAIDLILTNLSLNIAGDIPDDQGPQVMWDWLESRYGDDNRWDLEREFKELKMTSIEPKAFLARVDNYISRIKAAGGTVLDNTIFTVILNGINQEFYLNYIRDMREKYASVEVKPETITELRKKLKDFYKSTPENTRSQFESVKKKYEALNTFKSKPKSKHQRFCQKCSDQGLTDYVHTHDTAYHRDDWVEKSKNKEGQNYDIYLDSGANSHFFKDRPRSNYRKANGQVRSANGTIDDIIGEGDEKVGNLLLKNVKHVPTFKKNLVSVVEITKTGGEIVLDSEGFTVVKGKRKLATGEICKKSNLLKFSNSFECLGTEINASDMQTDEIDLETVKLDLSLLHQRLGHVNNGMVKDTVANLNGNESVKNSKGNECICEPCVLQNSRRRPYPKTRHEKPKVLERIAADVQGPFSTKDIEGCHSNLKLVDIASGYTRIFMLPNKMSETIANHFKDYILQMERRTGKNIGYIETDRGTEFQGSCDQLLKDLGITHVKGNTLDHHYPGKAERMNQTITRMARTMLHHSNLPRKYYGEAHKTAVYIYNRMIHGNATSTPYELMYGQKPKIDHIRIFGSICYAYVPTEQRDKLDPERQRCRLLGYGDDDSDDQFAGYRLLLEDPFLKGKIIHTSDVIFNEELDMTELAGYRLIKDDLFPEFSDQNYSPNSSIESSISQSTNSTNTEPSTNTEEESNYEPSEDPLLAQQVIGLMDINHIVDSDDEEDRRQGEVIQELDRKYQHLWEANNVLDISTKRLLECLNSTQDPAIPSTYEEAINGKDSAHWIAAMDREMNSIRNAKTYVVKRPHKSKLKKNQSKIAGCILLNETKKGKSSSTKADLLPRVIRRRRVLIILKHLLL